MQIDDPWHMLSEEERMFCEVLERLCADKVAPLAAETDESSRFVHEQLGTLGEAGMMGANLPEAYGGGGISAPALLRAVSIVAGACGSTASALTAHYLATDFDPDRRHRSAEERMAVQGRQRRSARCLCADRTHGRLRPR